MVFQVTTLINDAVSLIGDERYTEAIITLTKSLKTIKLIMSGDAMIARNNDDEDEDDDDDDDDEAAKETLQHQDRECGDDDNSDARRSDTVRSELSCDFLSSSDSSSFLCSSDTGAQGTTLFRDPLRIDGVLLPSCILGRCELLSYVALYNLALAHHLRAMIETDEEQRIVGLEKAMTLYDHAYHVLADEPIQETVPLLHIMAITSNLGHTHLVLGDQERAHLCYQHLLSAVLYVVDRGEASKMKQFDGFFKIIMPLVSRTLSAPAA